jgi:F0F1-type ATP synthase assembly protein I
MSGGEADKESAEPEGGRYPGPMAYASLGMLNAICLFGGCILGWLADRALGTLPLFLFVGLLGGAALGVLGTRAELRRYDR